MYFQEEYKVDLAIIYSYEIYCSRTVTLEDAQKAEAACGTADHVAKAILKEIEVSLK